MTKKHALNFPKDEKTARDFVQIEPLSLVRKRRGRLCVLVIRIGESRGGVTLGFHRSQAGPCEFLCLQVRFRSNNRRLGGVEVR